MGTLLSPKRMGKENIISHRHPRKKGKALRDERHGVSLGIRGQVIDQHGPLIVSDDPGEDVEERRLTAPRGTGQPEDLSVLKREGEILYRHRLASSSLIGDREVLYRHPTHKLGYCGRYEPSTRPSPV